MSRFHATEDCDYLVVGSGAAGATAAVTLAEAGENTLVLEEGGWHRKENFTEDLYGAMKSIFRDFGAHTTRGNAVMPILEGSCVGGSTVMNGAIVHRFPESVHREWCADSGIAKVIPFHKLEAAADAIEDYLEVKRNLAPSLSQYPVSRRLKKLNWEHQAMLRNAPDCQGSGRCLQGCPTGGKWSMELTFIPRAMRAGARVYPRHRVIRVVIDKNRAVGVLCRNPQGETIYIHARKGVLIAAGVMHSPRILRRSGLGGREVGKHFQVHLGVGVVGFLNDRVRNIEGPPQGIEITEFQGEGIKLATQLVPPDILLARSPLVGKELTAMLTQADQFSSWMGSIRSRGEGIVGRFGTKFQVAKADLEKARIALWRMAQLQFELGATRVFPGILGTDDFPHELNSADEAHKLLALPLNPKNYLLSAGHLFGTCRMGSDPRTSVVGPTGKVHGVTGVYVVDGSVFPTNIGVNPQHAIMTLALNCTLGILANTVPITRSKVETCAIV